MIAWTAFAPMVNGVACCHKQYPYVSCDNSSEHPQLSYSFVTVAIIVGPGGLPAGLQIYLCHAGEFPQGRQLSLDDVRGVKQDC